MAPDHCSRPQLLCLLCIGALLIPGAAYSSDANQGPSGGCGADIRLAGDCGILFKSARQHVPETYGELADFVWYFNAFGTAVVQTAPAKSAASALAAKVDALMDENWIALPQPG